MNLNEFNAWLDGFSEAITDAPTPEQWAKIKEKLAQATHHVRPIPADFPRPVSPSVAPTWPLTPTWVHSGMAKSVLLNSEAMQ